MNIPITYWRDDKEIVNLGDDLARVIVELMGHTTCSPQEGRRTLVGIGSLLSHTYLDNIPGEKLVWGTGSWGQELSNALRMQLTFHAVRGPKTREFLRLPKTVPLGDPALLLPLLLPDIQDASRASTDVLYIPHCAQVDGTTRAEVKAVGATEFLPITCTRDQSLERVRRIANAEFVLTGSLHAAIIAQAFEVPWALCLTGDQKLVMPFKHEDWAEYLGLKRLEVVTNISQGLQWWKQHGRHGRIQDLQPLLQAFPFRESQAAATPTT